LQLQTCYELLVVVIVAVVVAAETIVIIAVVEVLGVALIAITVMSSF
jgi:hypothetical protein